MPAVPTAMPPTRCSSPDAETSNHHAPATRNVHSIPVMVACAMAPSLLLHQSLLPLHRLQLPFPWASSALQVAPHVLMVPIATLPTRCFSHDAETSSLLAPAMPNVHTTPATAASAVAQRLLPQPHRPSQAQLRPDGALPHHRRLVRPLDLLLWALSAIPMSPLASVWRVWSAGPATPV